MRKMSIILLLVVGAFGVNAQVVKEKIDNYPYWTISKDVQRIRYKDVAFVPAKITTGNHAWNIAKGAAQMSVERSSQSKGKVAMTGFPAWTISKGAARMQYEMSNKD